MGWKRIAPWNWFKEEEVSAPRSLVRRSPAPDPVGALRTDMERLFDETFRRFEAGEPFSRSLPSLASPLLRPSVDISEGRKAYTVRAELPGMEADDLSIEVEGQTLLIRGEKRRESEQEDEGYHCMERAYGAVQRVLSLPDDADADAIDAHFRNGVLELQIPKQAPRAARGRRIEIQPN